MSEFCPFEQGQIHLCTDFVYIVAATRHRFQKTSGRRKVIPHNVQPCLKIIHHFEIEWDKQEAFLTSKSKFIPPVEWGLP